MYLMDIHFPLNSPFPATCLLSFLLDYLKMSKNFEKYTLRSKINNIYKVIS